MEAKELNAESEGEQLVLPQVILLRSFKPSDMSIEWLRSSISDTINGYHTIFPINVDGKKLREFEQNDGNIGDISI